MATRSRTLRPPLDVVVARKLGVPGQPELAMSAIATGVSGVVNQSSWTPVLLDSLGIPPVLVEALAAREGQELERRERRYRGIARRSTCEVDRHRFDRGLATSRRKQRNDD